MRVLWAAGRFEVLWPPVRDRMMTTFRINLHTTDSLFGKIYSHMSVGWILLWIALSETENVFSCSMHQRIA